MQNALQVINLDRSRFSDLEFENLCADYQTMTTADFIDKYIDFCSTLVQTKLLCIKTDALLSATFITGICAAKWKRYCGQQNKSN